MNSFSFLITNILLGVGLAMDAFSVSLVNGLNNPKMRMNKFIIICLAFGVFQMGMPLIGWVCVHTLLDYFNSFSKFIPWIALVLLLYIGGKMLIEGLKGETDESYTNLNSSTLIMQGIATSIDALSVGFTIANYDFALAFIASLIIGVVTSLISAIGLKLGINFGTKFTNKASILGGIILILIGIKVFIDGVL